MLLVICNIHTLSDVRCVPECNPEDILLLSVSKVCCWSSVLTTVFVYNIMLIPLCNLSQPVSTVVVSWFISFNAVVICMSICFLCYCVAVFLVIIVTLCIQWDIFITLIILFLPNFKQIAVVSREI